MVNPNHCAPPPPPPQHTNTASATFCFAVEYEGTSCAPSTKVTVSAETARSTAWPRLGCSATSRRGRCGSHCPPCSARAHRH